MTPKEAHQFARRISMRCPCCEQPIVLRASGLQRNDEIDAFMLQFKRWRESGALTLIPAEECAQQIIDGDGEAIPGALS